METSNGPLPLNIYHVQKLLLIINRLHMLLHSTALGFLFYYRVCFLFQDTVTRGSHLLPWLLVFASEIILSFIWFVGQAFRWRPISRSVFPERLPEDDKLPAIDVFICTADPIKEPTLEVMNTVLSSMALDYPQDKLHVYLSDDGCSPITLHGLRKAFEFAKWWLPFCRRYRVKNRCPKAYFSGLENDDCDFAKSSVYMADKQKIKGKYDAFKEEIETFRKVSAFSGDSTNVRDHSSVIEVMQENDDVDNVKMPLLVYVSREKKPSNPHHFKAGALNVLLRVSAVMSNSPYILVLDCDMFCNDPTSARYAMCFHLDPKLSSSLSFVQFPQRFHNISKNDIYDSQLRSIFTLQWQGIDGLSGPMMSGTGFYIKRVSLYGIRANEGGTDLLQHQEYFGSSNEFIKSLTQNYTSVFPSSRNTLLKECHLLASCRYDVGTKWGQYVGFLYDSVVEDFLTGFILHCNGWTSVFSNPSKPHFLGTATTTLNDVLIQGTRWYSGLFENGISKFCPLIYGTKRMPLLQSLCFVEITYFPLYCLPLWCFAIIPQLCLLNGVTLYPKVSDPFFIIFVFIFVSSLSKHLLEVFLTGGTLQKWINEQRIWMIRSTTSHLYGCLDALLKKVGLREASFLPTNKAEDDEQTKLYQLDKYDFRTSNIFIVPILVLLTVNIFCFVVGVYRVISAGDWDKMFMQLALAGFIIIVNYPIIEGLVIRKDKGRISQSVATRVILATMILLASMNCYKMHNMP